MTGVLLALWVGLATLTAAGALAWWAALIAGLALWWRPAPGSVAPWARAAAAGGWVLGLVALVAAVATGQGAPRALLAGGLVWLALPRRWAASGPAGDRMATLLSALMVLLGASTTANAWTSLGALGWILVAPLALASASARGARAMGAIRPTWAVWALAGLLFFVLPRWGAPPPPDAVGAVTGASEQVAHRRAGGPVDDERVALRLTLPAGVTPPTYLRGAALSGFDGVRWWSLDQRSGVAVATEAPPGAHPVVVSPERAIGVAFTPWAPVALASADGWWLDASGTARRAPSVAPYTVYALPGDAAPWTQAPSTADRDLPAAQRETLRAMLEPLPANDVAIVARIERLLADGYRYSRAPRADGAEATLERFLRVDRVGHCEEFASAAAALARAAGLPARVVTGFHGGERGDAPGSWVLRAHTAHAWAEVWVGDHWQLVDATPLGARGLPERDRVGALTAAVADGLAWLRSYDRGEQRALLTGGSPWLLAVGGLAALAWLARRWAKRAPGRVAVRVREGERPSLQREWNDAMAFARAHGLQPAAHLPPLSVAEWVISRDPRWSELRVLALLVYDARYRPTIDPVVAADARACIDRLRRQVGPPGAAPG